MKRNNDAKSRKNSQSSKASKSTPNPRPKEEIKRIFIEGEDIDQIHIHPTLTELAKRYKIPVGTVTKWASEEKWADQKHRFLRDLEAARKRGILNAAEEKSREVLENSHSIISQAQRVILDYFKAYELKRAACKKKDKNAFPEIDPLEFHRVMSSVLKLTQATEIALRPRNNVPEQKGIDIVKLVQWGQEYKSGQSGGFNPNVS